ncbi:alcohol dehydrogenase catalytic domain-containing protein, partial [Mesorhizobium sp. M7A.F.Ca.CA.004.12.1.1]
MRALQLIEDRRLETVDLPPPPPPALGEVTLRIKAVALNHIDVWGWRGMAFAKRKLPLVVGAEASGEVEAVGSGVSSLLPGQLVSIYG